MIWDHAFIWWRLAVSEIQREFLPAYFAFNVSSRGCSALYSVGEIMDSRIILEEDDKAHHCDNKL